MQLQQRSGEHPHRRSSHVRKHRAGTCQPYRAATAKSSVPNSNDEIAEENAKLQPSVAAACPTRRDERTDERSQAPSAEQDAHAQHRSAGGIGIVPAHRKLMSAHHGEDDPTRANHKFTSLRK